MNIFFKALAPAADSRNISIEIGHCHPQAEESQLLPPRATELTSSNENIPSPFIAPAVQSSSENLSSSEIALRKRPSRRRRSHPSSEKTKKVPSLRKPGESIAVLSETVPGASRSDGRQSGRRPKRKGERQDRLFDSIEQSIPHAATVRDDGAPADIASELLDQDGLRVLDCLHRNGFEAYFVGGCVRDLLIGQKPKDFDISTSARPEEIRALFANSRLIGRRFRLAHVFFHGDKILEVSTFRAKPPHTEVEDVSTLAGEDLLIIRDNSFGTSTEDALRRDLTINGLFYDVERGRVLDFVGTGLSDLRERQIRTIGDPEVRLREDPVRILRAVRFAARFDFEIETATWGAMKGAVGELPRCAAPRLLEEFFKFLRSGVAHTAFRTLHEIGVFDFLLAPIGQWLDQAEPTAREFFFKELKSLDECVRKTPLDDAILLAALLSPLIEFQNEEILSRQAEDFLTSMARDARLPRRISDRVRKLFWAEAILTGRRRRKRSLRSFRLHPEFVQGLKLLEIHSNVHPELREIFEIWSSGNVPGQILPQAPAKKPKVRRRRRSRSRHKAELSAGTAIPSEAAPGGVGEDCLQAGREKGKIEHSNSPSIQAKERPAEQLSFNFKP